MNQSEILAELKSSQWPTALQKRLEIFWYIHGGEIRSGETAHAAWMRMHETRRSGRDLSKRFCLTCLENKEDAEFSTRTQCSSCQSKVRHYWYVKDHDYNKKLQRVKLYGISIEQYEKMVLRQNNLCAICGASEHRKWSDGSTKPLSIDHCHRTGTVRGLLCQDCNHGLGGFRDNPTLLISALEYINSPRPSWNAGPGRAMEHAADMMDVPIE